MKNKKDEKKQTANKEAAKNKSAKTKVLNKNNKSNKVVREKESYNFSLLEVLVIMMVTVIFGISIGIFADNLKSPFTKGGEQVSTSNELNEFVNVYEELKENYYGDLDSKALAEAGIAGMLDYLGDEYSIYLNDDQSQNFSDELNGEFVGMGASVSSVDDIFTIVEVFKDSPAEKAGLKSGDIILRVDETESTEVELQELVDMIRGKKGTSFEILISRAGEEHSYEIERGVVTLPSVSGEIYNDDDKKLAYVKVDTFAANTAVQFKSLMDEYVQKEKVDSVVIDLRNNTGGHLTVVEAMAEMFLDEGDVVYQLKDNEKTTKNKTNKKAIYDIPVVFITNEVSASASEVLVAALKDNDKAVSVGKTTYGKGSVQTARDLTGGSMIKYTIKEWLTPTGKQINKVGITPDYEVSLSEKYYETLNKEDDNQLQKALEVAKERK